MYICLLPAQLMQLPIIECGENLLSHGLPDQLTRPVLPRLHRHWEEETKSRATETSLITFIPNPV